MLYLLLFVFFKQKTAYDMRISDWSSAVCSSDLIVVSDNGPGMPDAVAAVTEGQQAGTATGGIGLALARQLVAAHGGTMEVMSEKGQGTLVRITLPRRA